MKPERRVGVLKTSREWESAPGRENNPYKGMGVHKSGEVGGKKEGLKLMRMRCA